MNPFRHSRVVLPVVLCVVASTGRAADVVLSDQILPAETYLHLSIANIDAAREEFAESSFGRLIADPAMDDFKAEVSRAFGRQIEEGLSEIEQVLGFPPMELLEIPSGEIAFSVTSAGNRMGAVLYIDFGDAESQVRALLDKAEDALAEVSELTQTSAEFDGVEITLYEVDGPVPTPLAKEFGWFIRDTRLVICNSRRVMETLISNWDGTASDTFVTNDTYAQVLSRCQSGDRSAISTAYFDPVGLITRLVQTGSLGQAGLPASMAMGFFPTLGVNQLKAFGAVSEAGTSDFEGVTRAMMYVEQPPQGIMRAFMLQSMDAAPPDWVKEDAVMYAGLNWQADEAYSAIESLVDMFQGAGGLRDMLDQLAQSGPRIQIKDDIIDQLTGSVRVVGGPTTATAPSGEMLFALEIRDSEKFSDLLARATDQPGFPGSVREFRGVTLYEIQAGQGQAIAFTIANGNFMMSMGNTLLEQVLRNDSDVRPLAESDDFRRIARHFPSDVVAVNFSRPAEQYRSLYEMLKNGEAAEMFQGMDEIFAQIDFSTLPPFDVISSYVQPSGGYTVNDQNGMVSETFTLKP